MKRRVFAPAGSAKTRSVRTVSQGTRAGEVESAIKDGSATQDPVGPQLGTSYVWIDDLALTSVGGWIATVTTTEVEPQVLVAGVEATIEWGQPRPDVGEALGVDAREFRVAVDVANHALDEQLDIRIEFPGSVKAEPFEFQSSPLEILNVIVEKVWEDDPPHYVARWREGAQDPAIEADWVIPGAAYGGKLRAVMGEGRGPGPREDLAFSNFQAHRYYRHVREHQGFWRDRHRPLATADDSIDYLIWSLRDFSNTHPSKDLPVFPVDASSLNQMMPGTGLTQWNSLELRGALDYTRAQLRFLQERRVSPARDADSYADALLAWLGSWGARHRGVALLTESQVRYLAGSARLEAAPTVAEACELTPFALARWRESSYFRTRYPNLQRLAERYAYLMDLWTSELLSTKSRLFVPEWFTTQSPKNELNGFDANEFSVNDAVPLGEATSQVDVRVLGMISSKSGLGQNARNSLDAFRSLGLTCVQQEIALNDRTVAGKAQEAPAIDNPLVNLWHVNPDNLPEAMLLAGDGVYSGAYNIAFFAWELDQHPRSHELAVELADELWVPSEYVRQSFLSITDKPITVMPHAIVPPQDWSPASRESLGLPLDRFVVYSGFDLHSWPGRKNPLGVVSAFRRAFREAESVTLLLRIRNGRNLGLVDSDPDDLGRALLDLAESDPRIVIDMEERDYGQVLSLVANSDCYLSLHRSEGFGYGPAEALFLGTPIVVSDNSATSEFCHPAYCHLVPCEERYLTPGEYYLSPGGSRWFEPDVSEAARQLRSVRDNKQEAEAMAKAGMEFAQENLTLSVMASLYAKRLEELNLA